MARELGIPALSPTWFFVGAERLAPDLSLDPHHPSIEGDALARVRITDWAGALAAVEQRNQRADVLVLTSMARDFLHALVLARLGRAGEARICYEHAMAEWDLLTVGKSGAWAHSDAMSWRSEAEAALEKQ